MGMEEPNRTQTTETKQPPKFNPEPGLLDRRFLRPGDTFSIRDAAGNNYELAVEPEQVPGAVRAKCIRTNNKHFLGAVGYVADMKEGQPFKMSADAKTRWETNPVDQVLVSKQELKVLSAIPGSCVIVRGEDDRWYAFEVLRRDIPTGKIEWKCVAASPGEENFVGTYENVPAPNIKVGQDFSFDSNPANRIKVQKIEFQLSVRPEMVLGKKFREIVEMNIDSSDDSNRFADELKGLPDKIIDRLKTIVQSRILPLSSDPATLKKDAAKRNELRMFTVKASLIKNESDARAKKGSAEKAA
jgi:hypothetical protein